MEYGPAIQTSIGSIILSDLQHTCKNGESVQLFSITSNCSMQESINLLYRKVCIAVPKFRYYVYFCNSWLSLGKS